MVEGHIFTTEEIPDNYDAYLRQALAQLPSDTTHIVHHISSPGGSVYGGYKGYHVLLGAGKPITSIIEGEAQSMATFIAMAGNKVIMNDPGVFMIHNPSQGLKGDADAFRSSAEELQNIENDMSAAYAKKTGLSVDEIKKMMKSTKVMNAQAAKQLGFIDEIKVPLKAVALGKSTMTTDNKTLLQKIGTAIAEAFTQLGGVPSNADYPITSGGILQVDGELAQNTKATVDGQPANGTYKLDNGKMVTCANGVITVVADTPTPAPAPPVETPEQAQIKQLQGQLAALQAAQVDKATADAAAAKTKEEADKAKAEKEAAVQMLAQIQKDFDELKKKTVGDDNPTPGPTSHARTAGNGMTQNEIIGIRLSRIAMAEHTPWLEKMPVFQKKYPGGQFPDGTYFKDYMRGGRFVEGPEALSLLEPNLNYTWNGILDLDIFFKPSIGTPALSDFGLIDLGAKDTKRYHLLNPISNILKPYTGCDQAVGTSRLQITSKAIQLKPFQMYEGWCKDDFTQQLSGSFNVFAQEWLKSGVDSFDPAGTPIDRIINDQLKDTLRRDVFQRFFFGSKASSSANYSQIDGYWTNLINDSGASNYCVYRSNPANAYGTGALAANAAMDGFKRMFNGSNMLLKQEVIDKGLAEIKTTRSIWENYYDSLVAVGSVSEAEYENFLNGIKTLTFRGIPIKPVNFWDQSLADSNNPLFATTRHLAILTWKNNHIFGIENEGDLNKIDSWFEKKDNKRYYRSNMIFGYQKIHCDLQTIEY